MTFSLKAYHSELESLFQRYPSVQNVPFTDAYKPGLERMTEFDRLLGYPSKKFKSVHVAGTNGKGSVASMLAASLAASGYKTGLYTSPHLLDFRERMKIVRKPGMVPKEYVFDFIMEWKDTFEKLSLSFFEITTGMAFKWFADSGVDVAVVEVGLGGRLDSTNIIVPTLSVITSIGLDHCALLGDTLEEIAAEKAGIFKKAVPAVIGETLPETAPVFVEKAEKTGVRELVFAEKVCPRQFGSFDEILCAMDLQGPCQRKNLRTVAAALEIMADDFPKLDDPVVVQGAIKRTAEITDFHGRWEKLSDSPYVLCDIGHNAPALKGNFGRLRAMMETGKYSSLTIVYGVMADKDLDAILPLMPTEARYVFVTPHTARALAADRILARLRAWRENAGLPCENLSACDRVSEAVERLMAEAAPDALIYIGGSTFVVTEALQTPSFHKGLPNFTKE